MCIHVITSHLTLDTMGLPTLIRMGGRRQRDRERQRETERQRERQRERERQRDKEREEGEESKIFFIFLHVGCFVKNGSTLLP